MFDTADGSIDMDPVSLEDDMFMCNKCGATIYMKDIMNNSDTK